MNIKLNKIYLKGYTIHEMIVVLSISSIIIIMGLLFYETTLQSYSKKINSLDEGLILSSLYSRLENDLFTCTGIKATENEVVFFFRNDSVQYSFTESAIIINRNKYDTIDLACEDFQLLKKHDAAKSDSFSLLLILTFSVKNETDIEINLFRNLPLLFKFDLQVIEY